MWGPWQDEFKWSFDQLTNVNGLSVAGLGLGCPLLIPFANKFGKRPIYIVASALVVATSAWLSQMEAIGEAYGSMFLQGLAVSVCETIIQMTVADLYFVHERGTFNGIYMFVVDVGNFLVLVPAGYITINIGWRWVFIIVAIIGAVQFLMTVFFFEETNYTLPDSLLVSELPCDGLSSDEQVSSEKNSEKTGEISTLQHQTGEVLDIPRNPLSKRLALVAYTPGSWKEFLRKILAPFIVLFSYPIVAFAAMQYGCMLSFVAMVSTTTSDSFAAPPYNFSAAGIGNINIAPCVGMLLGCIYGGWFNDKTIIWMSNRNHGVYEPEFRLYSLIFANFSMTVGMFMLGIPIAKGVQWIVPAIGFAIVAFAYGSSGSIVVTYLIDCYSQIVGDAFIGVVVVRNGLGMVIIFCMSPWVDGIGLQNVYIMGGCFTLIPLILTIPMIIWGKELRRRSESRYLKESQRG
ncbi:putative MFS-type transporter [Yarrowia sp. B02]|nr:putative MFS-type transporter [Yarrowia sp. B02]